MPRSKIAGLAMLVLLSFIAECLADNLLSPPKATEVFHLRSECAKLGEKILDASFIGPALYKSQISHYNPQTNRFYVELTVQNADTTKPLLYLSRYLYDGQTGEMLAVAQIKEGEKWGIVYDQSYETRTLANGGWDDANRYIIAMMADERKQ